MNDIQSRPKIRKLAELFLASACFGLLLVSTAASYAQPGLEMGISAGWYEPDRPEEAVELGFDITLPRELFWGIRQQFGALVTSDESLFGYSGFRFTVPFSQGESDRKWRVDLHSSLGLYAQGEGKDLGGVVEFRSGIDLMRRRENGDFFSLSFHHISNAGIYDRNPGSNSLLIRYVFGRR